MTDKQRIKINMKRVKEADSHLEKALDSFYVHDFPRRVLIVLKKMTEKYLKGGAP